VQVLLLLLSFAGFAVVLRAIMDIFSGAMAEAPADGSSRLLLGRMLALTLVVWSMFPLVWLLGQARLVSLTVEQVRRTACAVADCHLSPQDSHALGNL
jgi:bacteriorhodopsin